jgi:predicted Rossmann-fold nucleotide-binding protein
MQTAVTDAIVTPDGSMEVLSQLEIDSLLDSRADGLYALFRRCCLAVLNSGSPTDDARALFEHYSHFDIHLVQRVRGITLELKNAPASAFVDGEIIRGIGEHLFTVLRDIIYTHNEIRGSGSFDLRQSRHITSAVFHILRNANVLHTGYEPNLAVCWGGHSISRLEYDYTKEVGYELGLRGLDVCTGCGPGAMKGPMKGAAVGHAKQRIHNGRYIGVSEPGIIAAEAPNPIVNELVIMPDIEKRLEAFVRLGHGVIIFPGGVGTAEELLFLLGVLLHPDNRRQPLPLILTGPRQSAAYFAAIDHFIGLALGADGQRRYQIIIDDPAAVARRMKDGMKVVHSHRLETHDAFYFNWLLRIADDFQQPFTATHDAMAALRLLSDRPRHELAADLRKAFSGIVTGNVKDEGIKAVERFGPYRIHGDSHILQAMDNLLDAFARQGRMKLSGSYQPCYQLLR